MKSVNNTSESNEPAQTLSGLMAVSHDHELRVPVVEDPLPRVRHLFFARPLPTSKGQYEGIRRFSTFFNSLTTSLSPDKIQLAIYQYLLEVYQRRKAEYGFSDEQVYKALPGWQALNARFGSPSLSREISAPGG